MDVRPKVLLETAISLSRCLIHSFTDKTWRVSKIKLSFYTRLRWVAMPNEWLAAPRNRSVVSEVYCCAISFRARYNICGANSFIALLHLFSSWCAVAKRRGGGFYLSSNKWCAPVVQNNIATGGIRACGAVPIYLEATRQRKMVGILSLLLALG